MFPKQFVHCHICKQIDYECDKECYEQFCEERNINIHSACFVCPDCMDKSLKNEKQKYSYNWWNRIIWPSSHACSMPFKASTSIHIGKAFARFPKLFENV